MQWVAPSKCSKRDAEVQHNMKNDSKSVLQLEKDALVVTPKDHATADVSNELRLQWALQRRGIAFDQCFLVSWHVHQAWVTLLMETMSEELPPGYVQVSAAQALRADKELWTLASKASAGSFIADSAGKSPCDQLVKDHMRHPKIARMLLPLPKGLASHANSAGIKDAELDNQAPKRTPKKTKKNPRKTPCGCKACFAATHILCGNPGPVISLEISHRHIGVPSRAKVPLVLKGCCLLWVARPRQVSVSSPVYLAGSLAQHHLDLSRDPASKCPC